MCVLATVNAKSTQCNRGKQPPVCSLHIFREHEDGTEELFCAHVVPCSNSGSGVTFKPRSYELTVFKPYIYVVVIIDSSIFIFSSQNHDYSMKLISAICECIKVVALPAASAFLFTSSTAGQNPSMQSFSWIIWVNLSQKPCSYSPANSDSNVLGVFLAGCEMGL